MFDLNKIHEIATGIDDHLRKLESFIGVLRDVKLSIELLRQSQEKTYIYELNKLKSDVAYLTEVLTKYGLPTSSVYEKELDEIRKLLEADWPCAVDPGLLCDTPQKAELRASSILDLFIAENLKGKRFLDFGCGEGYTVPAAIKREAEFAIGYDIDVSKFKFDKHFLTEDYETVLKYAPYDVVLLHDVLDHIMGVDPIEILKKIKNILSNEGRIYVRNHPWCSRHGGHLYFQKNCAFLHLVLDQIELLRCFGIETEHNLKILTPLETYRYWIKEADLVIKSETPIKSLVEPFFTTPSTLNERLRKNWKDTECIQNYMEIDFVEYVLELPSENSNRQIF